MAARSIFFYPEICTATWVAVAMDGDAYNLTDPTANQPGSAGRWSAVAQVIRRATVALSPREAECLQWAADGKSEWEISQILGISEHTSEKHLLSAKKKLGAATRVHAVAEAIRRGIIT